jgi:hypothetical protein
MLDETLGEALGEALGGALGEAQGIDTKEALHEVLAKALEPETGGLTRNNSGEEEHR